MGYTASGMRVITSTEDLQSICQRLAAAEFVAVDTEFMREQTFWPKLCLIQLAGPGEEIIVDPLASALDLPRLLCAHGE